MTIRAFWLISLTRKFCDSQILFERYFKIAEERLKKCAECYLPCPSGLEVVQALIELNIISQEREDEYEAVISCSKQQEGPVYSLNINAKPHWPFVIIKQDSLLYCGLCAVNSSNSTNVCLPEIVNTFSLLVAISDFIGHIPSADQMNHAKLVELNIFIGEVAPFGSLLDAAEYNMIHTSLSKQYKPPTSTEICPSWRGVVPKSKAALTIVISEFINCSQFNSKATPDRFVTNGKIYCKSDLDGPSPEVIINIIPAGLSQLPPSLITHPVVQTSALQSYDKKGKKQPSWRLVFIPPVDLFPLCLFSSSQSDPPLHATYTCQGETKTEFSFSLKKPSDFKGSFDYLEVVFPFTHIGSIKSANPEASHGSVQFRNDKKSLVWNIGTKLPAQSKHLEASLRCVVHFKSSDTVINHDISFAQLNYKIVEYSNTSLTVDSSSVVVHPSSKHKLTIGHELLTKQHKVFNSAGQLHPGLITAGTALLQLADNS